MTKTLTLLQVVSKAEVTPEDKNQRVIDWLNEVHRVLYKNIDLSKHTIKLHVVTKDNCEKTKLHTKLSQTPVHRLYSQNDHENARNTCSRGNYRERQLSNGQQKSNTNQLPTISKRQFSSSNSSQPTALARKSSSQQTRPAITSKVIRTQKQQQASKPLVVATNAAAANAARKQSTPTFRRRLRSGPAAPITAG